MRSHSVDLSKDIARLEVKVEASIAQAAIDRAQTTAHIAECNVRNKIADDRERATEERERYTALEWKSFMAESREDRRKLAEKVVQTQIRLATLIGGVAVIGFLVEHFHVLDHVLPP